MGGQKQKQRGEEGQGTPSKDKNKRAWVPRAEQKHQDTIISESRIS